MRAFIIPIILSKKNGKLLLPRPIEKKNGKVRQIHLAVPIKIHSNFARVPVK
jgi:hypothetical protein